MRLSVRDGPGPFVAWDNRNWRVTADARELGRMRLRMRLRLKRPDSLRVAQGRKTSLRLTRGEPPAIRRADRAPDIAARGDDGTRRSVRCGTMPS